MADEQEIRRIYEEGGWSTVRLDQWAAFLAGWLAAHDAQEETKVVVPQREGDYL